MRIMIVGYNDIEVEDIKKNIDKKFRDFIYFDLYTDIGEAEYMSCIRSYDLVFMKNNPSKYLEYLNLFKEFKHQEFLKVIFFEKKEGKDNIKLSYNNFLASVSKIFSYINIEYVNDNLENFDYIKFISEYTLNFFTKSPETIQHISINYERQSITINLKEGDSFSVEIPKQKDFKILIYFIRHYGEVISVNSILSGISSEPENILTSPIETGISTIRKLFKLKTPSSLEQINPIRASKRIGYSFQVGV